MSALVASLFAVGAAPAHGDVIGADDSKAEASNTTKQTACLGPALADQGFTDLGTLEAAVPNINCLAYYGITLGKTLTTFDPNSNVTRSEMALFLYRAAGLMGVDLMGGDMSADFGDVSELGEDRQNAIAALARNDILPGRGDMAFEPYADITRAEMAVALVALLDHTPGVGLSKATSGTNKGLHVFGSTPGTGDLPGDYFADARRTQPIYIDNAISVAYELGITTGVGDGTMFDPSGTIPRRDMATFIIRALNHSNVRPAGLTAQLIDGDIIVSVRDASFAPVLNAPVDAFTADVAHESRAFKDDGTCSSRTTAVEGNSKCAIGGGDPVTQSDGNVTLARVDPGDGKTAWIWTGAINDKVGADTDLFELSVPKGAATPVTAARAVVSNDLPKDPNAATPTDVERVRFGRTVTVTIQLKGASGGADADKDAKPAEGSPPVKYTVVTSTHSVADDDSFVATAIRWDTQTVTVDSDGKATFTLTAADPDSRSGMSNQLGVRYAISVPQSDGSTNDHALAIDPPASNTDDIIFTDAAPVVSYVSIENPGPQVAPGTNASAGAAVTIKAQDQYGDPFRGASVFLHSSNPNTGTGDADGGSAIATRAFTTGSSGTVRMTYSYTGGAYEETLRASWDGSVDLNGDGETTGEGESGTVGVVTDIATDAHTEDKVGTTMVLWVLPTEDPASPTSAPSVLSLDAENSQIVVDLQTGGAVTPTSVNFDSNDFFIVICAACGENNAGATRYMSMTDFVAELTKELATAKVTAGDDQPTLQWAGYVHDDSSNITSFTLTLGTGR